jgi:hypothetical protein
LSEGAVLVEEVRVIHPIHIRPVQLQITEPITLVIVDRESGLDHNSWTPIETHSLSSKVIKVTLTDATGRETKPVGRKSESILLKFIKHEHKERNKGNGRSKSAIFTQPLFKVTYLGILHPSHKYIKSYIFKSVNQK